MRATEMIARLNGLIKDFGDLEVESIQEGDGYALPIVSVDRSVLRLDPNDTYDCDTPEETPVFVLAATFEDVLVRNWKPKMN